MFSLSPKQRRRWTLPLVVVFLLHWCFGIGAVAASVVCLEPTGQVTFERTDKPCPDAGKTDPLAKHCTDLPSDDGHQDHELSARVDAKTPEAGGPALFATFPVLLHLPAMAPPTFRQILAPPASSHPAVLREAMVLHI